jgi:hypothetical protein
VGSAARVLGGGVGGEQNGVLDGSAGSGRWRMRGVLKALLCAAAHHCPSVPGAHGGVYEPV